METQDLVQVDYMSDVSDMSDVSETKVVIDVTGLPTLQQLERQYLEIVMAKTAGNKTAAAKILDISVKTIYNKLGSYKAASFVAKEENTEQQV